MPCPGHSEFDQDCAFCRVIKELDEAKKTIAVQERIKEAKKRIAVQDEELKEAKKRIKEAKKRIKEAKKRIAVQDEELKQFPTLGELCDRGELKTYNLSTSSGHIHTKHESAEVNYCETIPLVELMPSFWDHRPKMYLTHKEKYSETQVNSHLGTLLTAVVHALGLEKHICVIEDVCMIGTAPDVGLLAIDNRLLIGTIEGKKDPINKNSVENDWMWGSNTSVAGEVFEQIYLASGQLRTSAVGMLSTGNVWQLVSMESFSQKDKIDSAKILAGLYECSDGKSNLSPVKPRLIATPPVARQTTGRAPSFTVAVLEAKKARPTPPIEMPTTFPPCMRARDESDGKKKRPRSDSKKGKNTEKKRGKVTELAKENELERKYYASDLFSLGDAKQNRKVVELVAIFVLASVQKWQEALKSPPHVLLPDRWYPCRTVSKKRFERVSAVQFPQGIDWMSNTQITECTEFHAICQLGYGVTGACCFAVTNKATPVVIKFYRSKGIDGETVATAECSSWRHVYPDMEVLLIELANDKYALVMQFLSGVHDDKERGRLLKGGAKSPLFTALLTFAKTGKKHKDLKWHHVGTFRKGRPDASVRLYDLETVEDLDNEETANQWARDAFNFLNNREIEMKGTEWHHVIEQSARKEDPNAHNGNQNGQSRQRGVGKKTQSSSNRYKLLDSPD